MHSINGYMYGNLPGLSISIGDQTRWYLYSLNSEQGFCLSLFSQAFHIISFLCYNERLFSLVFFPPFTHKVLYPNGMGKQERTPEIYLVP